MFSSTAPPGSAEDPGPDQASRLLSHPAPALRRRGHGVVAPPATPTRLELVPGAVPEPPPTPGAAAPGPGAHVLDAHAGSVFPLLTPAERRPESCTE